ncbi:Serine/threonine-protein kinase pkn1 [Sedimentisphaera cyanobacteriorum]|uniref:Serine/threonine-protein kinase pkn1 n=1 Tax=Sedimentisphaera cyanobacteriorum TaxID=1940790 RepID=A0A1Q2HR13_9BACT|nr:SUMF1/EgtB/PvdO family nonheme iron enzyme [Sedimentisphaera cyanobacteriorum]AQQ09686.1 Serine/threonine-protein kinase pkn1 [Sedimentisphaera cyanobacteriorum]
MYKHLLYWFLINMFCWAALPSKAHSSDFTNSLGMEMFRIEAGKFEMGGSEGETLIPSDQWDEKPVHQVTVTQPFYMASTEVTNAQYEQFDPEHSTFRGLRGVSSEDNDAVVYVSWNEAEAFCEWLSQKEGKNYRLPTEAEWEYACRAGTSTAYWTGSELPEAHHRNQWVERQGNHKDSDLRKLKGKVEVSLQVGTMPPNPWGLHEMHGNVEEWVSDWYGQYSNHSCLDPVGPADGMFKVTRGGSHNTALKYLRSANRSATLPEDKHWLIGFRVVQAPMPDTDPAQSVLPEMSDPSADQQNAQWSESTELPFFSGPIPFVQPDSEHPLMSELPHHHCPTITWAPNGDLIAAWFNTISEIGREMVIVSSRLRYNNGEWADKWDTARLFFAPADRNTTGSSLLNDGLGRIYFFNAIGDSGHHRDQSMMMSFSEDSGKTWSSPKIISDLKNRHKYTPMDSAFVENGGQRIVLSVDYAPIGHSANEAGSGVFISQDRGKSWLDKISNKSRPKVAHGSTDGLVAGFHINTVRLTDGRLLAMARGQGRFDINGHITKSYSNDEGETWTYQESCFPDISYGRRLVLMRLNKGPIMLVSFTDPTDGMEFLDSNGDSFTGYGMFAALSYDEGSTWPTQKLITPGKGTYDGKAHTGTFNATATQAEPKGYLAATQTPDDTIHLISSGLHYQYNLEWLETPADPPPVPNNSSENNSISPLLKWNKINNANSYRVYLGDSTETMQHLQTTADLEYQVASPLKAKNSYFWRVDALDEQGDLIQTGDVWKFTTGGLFGYWKLDEESGTTVKNAIEGGPDGTIVAPNNDYSRESGVIGKAVKFSPIDQTGDNGPRIELQDIGSHADIYTNTSTVAMWLYLDGHQQDPTGLFINRGTGTGFWMAGSNRHLRYMWDRGNYGSDITLPLNKWVYLAWVVEPNKASFYLFEDGEVRSWVNSQSHGLNAFSGPTRIGAEVLQRERFLSGMIDDVRIYNRPLSVSELQEFYQWEPLQSDLNKNGVVDGNDLMLFFAEWMYSSIE